jgi:hypothetical protein
MAQCLGGLTDYLMLDSLKGMFVPNMPAAYFLDQTCLLDKTCRDKLEQPRIITPTDRLA